MQVRLTDRQAALMINAIDTQLTITVSSELREEYKKIKALLEVR